VRQRASRQFPPAALYLLGREGTGAVRAGCGSTRSGVIDRGTCHAGEHDPPLSAAGSNGSRQAREGKKKRRPEGRRSVSALEPLTKWVALVACPPVRLVWGNALAGEPPVPPGHDRSVRRSYLFTLTPSLCPACGRQASREREHNRVTGVCGRGGGPGRRGPGGPASPARGRHSERCCCRSCQGSPERRQPSLGSCPRCRRR